MKSVLRLGWKSDRLFVGAHDAIKVLFGAALVAILVSGCSRTSKERVGANHYAPTNERQVFVFDFSGGEQLSLPPPTPLPRVRNTDPYDVIGKVAYKSSSPRGADRLKKLAAQLGADAVIVTYSEFVPMVPVWRGDAIKYRDPARQLPSKKPWRFP